jgi:hypothetical protein
MLHNRGSWDGASMHPNVRSVPIKKGRGSSEAFSKFPQKLFLSSALKAIYCGYRGSAVSKKKADEQPCQLFVEFDLHSLIIKHQGLARGLIGRIFFLISSCL